MESGEFSVFSFQLRIKSKKLKMVEHLGSGMSRILKAYDESVFEFSPNFLIVTFPFEEGFSLPLGNENGNESGNDNFTMIIEVIKSNPNITLDDLVSQTGIAKRTLSRELKRMQENETLRRVGSARAGHWEIVE